jgi:Chitobiase/beta-hexosaminidase C-terminal domain
MEIIKRALVLAFLLLGLPAFGQTIFNCSSGFVTANTTCGVGYNGTGGYQFQFAQDPTGVILGTAANLIPVSTDGGDHNGAGLIYQTAVNVQAFTAHFTWVSNGKNIAFTLNNNTSAAGQNSQYFASGAGCEAGFNQAFTGGAPPVNKVFALELDQFSPLTTSGAFTYSSAQIYQQVEAPCQPPYTSGNGTTYGTTFSPTKLSTSPLPLNSPAGTPLTCVETVGGTCDTFSANIGYDGSTVSLCLYDVTAANGSCSSSTSGTGTYFQQSWGTINIPSLVGSNTGYVGLNAGTNSDAIGNLLINTFSYTVNTAPSTPSFSTWTTQTASGIGSSYSPLPSFSPAAGSYSGSQSVTITSAGSSSICYSLISSLTSTTLLPQPDSFGGCTEGTLYTAPVSVSSSTTLYAMATTGTNTAAAGMPSALATAAYTIGGGGTASTPIFSPVAGTYTGTQSVTLSTSSSGAIMCYTTNGATPATNGSTGCTTGTLYSSAITVSTSETLKAVAGGTGYTDSSVGSATYTIQANTPTFLPVAGSYVGTQSVTISTATSGAVICYNTTGGPATNGSTGCAAGILYSGPVTVSSSETLYAVAGGTGYGDSPVGSASYVVSSSAPAVISGKIVITGKTVVQ